MKDRLYIAINFLRRMIKKLTGIDDLVRLTEESRNIAAYIAWKEILKDEKYSDKRSLSRYGFKVHSQAEEDGIIHEIFRRIGSSHNTFLEIGSSNGLESNTLYLLRQGWKGAWIDGNADYMEEVVHNFNDYLSSGDLVFLNKMVTRENIDQVYKELVPEKGLGLLSIDIDGNDFHLLETISDLNVSVVVLEYNPLFAPPIEWVMNYNPEHEWIVGSDQYGASLKSFEKMLSKKGYALVGCTTNGNNAFFVKKDLVKNHFYDDYSAEFHYESQRFWLTNAFIAGYSFRKINK